jgi:light-regulated signal transduction histidine kinase (bacteriophytochrome)
MLSQVTRAEIRYSEVDLGRIAEAVMKELRSADPQRRVQFAAPHGVAVKADPSLMRVAMENLLGNAWKFTALRTEAKIEFGEIDSGGARTFFVRDNGAGFDAQYAEKKLFRAFQRLHSTEEFPGTGIGLSIVQRIVYRHSGRVWAEGVVNQGATFYFSL